MIAICRAWGVPARYVSGYLFTDRDEGDRSDPDATHAWVEVFLPSLRWVGFDPTNNIIAGERHVVVAVGRDYADVPPSRGVYKGEADSELAVGVSVRQTRTADRRAGVPAGWPRRLHRRHAPPRLGSGHRTATPAAATAATTIAAAGPAAARAFPLSVALIASKQAWTFARP